MKQFLKDNKGMSPLRAAYNKLLKNKLAVLSITYLCLIVLAILVGPLISKYSYEEQDFNMLNSAPSWIHWFGTDELGRDILVRCFVGGRISLAVASIATTISVLIGTTYGAVSGYIGGKIDELMMRFIDIVYTLPFMFIVIVLFSFFGRNIYLLFAALGAISWLTIARIVRGQVLLLKNQEFIEAAISIGATKTRIIFRHLIPNTIGPVIVYSTLTIPSVMIEESFLSFLGFGVQAPLSSWGTMISTAIESIAVYPWQLFFPSMIMISTLVSLNVLGEVLQNVLNPKSYL